MPNYVVSFYEYDDLNRLDKLTHFEPDPTPSDPTDNTTAIEIFEYTVRFDGKRTAAVETIWDAGSGNPSKTNSFTWDYDNAGRLIREQLVASDLDDYTTTYAFDLVGNRLEKATDNLSDGPIDETVSYDYDNNDRLLSEEARDGASTLVRTIDYEYGPSATANYGGDWTEQTKKIGTTVATGQSTTTDFTYNRQGRLQKTEIDNDGVPGVDQLVDSEYNDSGIRVSQEVDGGKTLYLIDANNPTGYAQVLEEHELFVNGGGSAGVIAAGIADHDLTATADWWNGSSNNGEFTVDGTYFVHDGQTIQIGPVKRGIGAQDGATGTGYILYSEERVHTRFSASPPLIQNSYHLIAVKLIGGQWHYDTNSAYVPFTPESTDILIAEVDFSADTIALIESGGSGSPDLLSRSYTLGHDVLSQWVADDGSGNPANLHLLYDGHGSTRLLTDEAGAIKDYNGIPQLFTYGAYGNAIGLDPAAALTTLLYSGEQFDNAIGQQYLRARYYDLATGRFNRMDPFAGNTTDPISLHKYLYVHGDPIQGIDPSGLEFSVTGLVGAISIGAITGGLIGGAAGAVLDNLTIREGIIYGAAGGAVLAGLIYSGAWITGAKGIGRFFFDPRAFPTISRGYWAQFGPANGASLHHWLIPHRWTWIPQAIRNAGFNLLNLPKILPGSLGLNQWMGFALRWGGSRMVVVIVVENGIRIAIPVSIAGAGAAGAWLSEELESQIFELDGGVTATPLNLRPDQLRQLEDDVTARLLEELDRSQ